jgi:small-conductance mechanosensitive channel
LYYEILTNTDHRQFYGGYMNSKIYFIGLNAFAEQLRLNDFIDSIAINVPGARFTLMLIFAALLFFIFDLITSFIINQALKIAQRTKTTVDDQIFDLIRKRKNIFFIVFAFFISIELFYGDIEIFSRPLFSWFIIFAILYAAFVVSDVVDIIFIYFITSISPALKFEIKENIAPFTRKVIKALLLLLAFTIVLGQLGIEITPLLAGLGIASLAVGLALQDTLSNFFSGLHILADKPLNVNDYVIIDKVEGFVKEINWRTTRLELKNRSEIIIPNKKIAESVIINYGDQNKFYMHTVNFSVGYGTNLNKLKRIFKEVIKELKEKGIVVVKKDVEPFLRLTNYGSDGLEFMAGFPVKHYTERIPAQSAFLELLYEKLNKENIDIPYPQRVLHIKGIEALKGLNIARVENAKKTPGKKR